MDQTVYQRWWPLHLRAARGEHLSAEERTFYEAGRKQLDQEEVLSQESVAARAAREKLTALEAERVRLQMRRQQLDAEITALEAALNEQTQQLLGVKD